MHTFTHQRRDKQRGAALLVALIALVALLGIGGVTILSVQSEMISSGHDRFTNIALYAAESGGAVAVEYLRNECSPTNMYSNFVEPFNESPQSPPEIFGNGARPLASNNPFAGLGEESQAWYEVTILNNITDEGFSAGDDMDATLVLRVVGHGPNQTVATLEIEIANDSCVQAFCARDYAQRGGGAANAANPACSQRIEVGATAVVRTP